jgi:FkbM family methyltransferase
MEIKSFNIRGRQLKAAITDEYIDSYWQTVEKGIWENGAYDVFDKFVDDRTVCFDLGAYIGFTCCYLAGISKATYAFEPDPVAFALLQETAKANELPNLTILPYAAGGEESTVWIKSVYSGGNSGSSLLIVNPKTSWEVRMVDMNRFIDEHAKGDRVFLKVDIEGYEYRLLKAMQPTWLKHRPVMFLALHPQILSRTVTGQGLLAKLRRRYLVVKEHYSLLFLHGMAKSIRFVEGGGGRLVLYRILLEAILTGKVSERRRELVVRF